MADKTSKQSEQQQTDDSTQGAQAEFEKMSGFFGQFAQNMAQMNQKFASESMRMMGQSNDTGTSVMFDVLDGWRQFNNMATAHPGELIEEQTQQLREQLQLLQNTWMGLSGAKPEPVITPEKGDSRFDDEDWEDNPLFNYLKQSYLLTSKGMLESIDLADSLDTKTRQRLKFFTRQWINAMAPTNFFWTNPEVLKLTAESGGNNLLRGAQQLVEDMENSADTLNVRMTDTSAFRVGDNIATAPGKVVYRNRMMELIQYAPSTEKVNKRPLVLVPPWINKFYIMDLREKNSLIRWAVAQGHTVFVLSWVNPTREYRDVSMSDYMHEGIIAALDEVTAITGEKSVNILGYCIGGMLVALALAWLKAKGQDKRIASATFLATIFDFSDPGDIGVFIDENIVSGIEAQNEKNGVFDGRMMAAAFSMLRENSLYWNYYIQNYLKGERPVPFDLLYWNSDCTNVPAQMHHFLLREFYLGNKLIQPGELEFDGVKIDMSTVTTPAFVVSTLQDHIAKWHSCYASTQVLSGDVTFVLGESGHIAGIMNPPTGKYGHYLHDEYPADPDKWYQEAEKKDCSWWLTWNDWLGKHTGAKVPARIPGERANGETQVLGDAPGEYVLVRAEEALKDS